MAYSPLSQIYYTCFYAFATEDLAKDNIEKGKGNGHEWDAKYLFNTLNIFLNR
jgi:hypothetical protein